MPDVDLPPRPALVVIPGVPILEVGEDWPASTGPATFTPEDLAAAVAAQDDPSVRSPILKLGHVRAGQPAFGRLQNMRTTNNGMTLVADIVGAPAWLADLLPYAWPSRSIEGARNETSGTGRTHLLRIDALALLGVELPAVSTLDEVAAVYTAASMEEAGVTLSTEIAASRGGAMPPMQIAAALTTEDVRRAYYDSLGPGQDWWWIRELQLDPLALIVDDDEGGLWRVPVTVAGDSVSFGQPVAVRQEFVDLTPAEVAASAATSATPPQARRIFYANRAESRGGLDMPDLTALRQSLELGDDVADDEVIRLASERLTAPPTTEGAPPATEDATPPATGTPAPQQVAASQVPPGMVLISQANLDAMNARIDQGVQASQTLARQQEDGFIARHRNRIGAASNPHAQLVEAGLRERFRTDPVAAETFASSMAVVVHASAPGHEEPGDEGEPTAAGWTEAELRMFPELRAAAGREG